MENRLISMADAWNPGLRRGFLKKEQNAFPTEKTSCSFTVLSARYGQPAANWLKALLLSWNRPTSCFIS